MKYKIVELTTPNQVVELAEGSVILTARHEAEHRSWDGKIKLPALWCITYLKPINNVDFEWEGNEGEK